MTVTEDRPKTVDVQLCGRDLRILRAVATGRIEIRYDCGACMRVDGLPVANSEVPSRLVLAGLVVAPDLARRPWFQLAELTHLGRVALEAAVPK